MTRGCRALMALADVMQPWAFKESVHQSSQWRENLPSSTLFELAHKIRLFADSIKPSMFSKFYERDVKRSLLNLLDALKCDADAEAAVQCLALHVCPAAFMHMPSVPASLEGQTDSEATKTDILEDEGCRGEDFAGDERMLIGESAIPADVIPETPSPVQRAQEAAWRTSMHGEWKTGAVLR